MFEQQSVLEQCEGKRCPGEDACPLLEPDALGDTTPEEQCGMCPMLPTKPGTEPRGLTEAIISAQFWSRRIEYGNLQTTLDTLSPFEWAALTGYRDGAEKFKAHLANRKSKETAE